jgi:hypothetical protein
MKATIEDLATICRMAHPFVEDDIAEHFRSLGYGDLADQIRDLEHRLIIASGEIFDGSNIHPDDLAEHLWLEHCRAYGDLGMTYDFIETVFDRDFSDIDDDTPEAQNEIDEPTCQYRAKAAPLSMSHDTSGSPGDYVSKVTTLGSKRPKLPWQHR